MKRVKLVVSVVLVSGVVSLLGCSGSTAAGDPASGGSATSAPAGTRVAPVAPNAQSTRVRMLADALSSVPLRDDQRAEIEALASQADARHVAAAGARAEVVKALAAQIEAGQIDRSALQSKIDAAADAANGARPADQAALQRLHALLTPEQRGQVADAIESRHKAMRGEHPRVGRKGRMAQWAADLKLTEAQQAQIAATFASAGAKGADARKAMHGWHGWHGEHAGGDFAESFRSETLTLTALTDAHTQANAMADHVVGMAQAVLPILTPEQRTLAAGKLLERAAAATEVEEAPPSE